MKFVTLHGFLLASSLWVPALSCQYAGPADGTLPGASQVMQLVVQRAYDVSRERQANQYAFEKRSINEELDASGKPTKTKQETYQVIPIGGVLFSRLVKVQNRDLTPEELEVQNRKEL